MGKYNLGHLSIEEKEQLKEYINSIKEIKKAIKELMTPKEIAENEEDFNKIGGNKSTGQILKI
jgi:hypothetical protein